MMLYCQHCKKRIDEDLVFCPKCGEVLVEEHAEWQDFEVREEVQTAKGRANMCVILAIVLVTLGMVGSGILFASSSLFWLFGIAFIFLGVGCTAAAARYEHKARILKNQLSRCD
jgi:RNA polymerase subunit RPABC4/transcription elongation factor Spt4